MTMSRLARFSCAVALGLSVVAPASAQDYPARPIRTIATSSAGGISDVFMRVLADELHKRLGQPVIVENRAGGAMSIGARACAEAPPDGYTLCIMPGEPLTYNQFVFKSIPYDPEKSFQPITNFFFLTQVLGASKDLKVKNMAELAAMSKAKAGTLSYTAPSSSLGLFVEKFKSDTGADIVRVPFKGGGDTVNAMISGSVPVGFLGLGNLISYIRSDMVTPLLVDGDERSPLLPDVPTIREVNYRDNHTRAFFGLLAPAGTPRPIVDKLRQTIVAIVNEPGFKQKHLIDRGLEPVLNTPEEFDRFLKEQRVMAQGIVKASGTEQR
jgi:tripartite-type tricarboxylate transporter receptor subunit TctC